MSTWNDRKVLSHRKKLVNVICCCDISVVLSVVTRNNLYDETSPLAQKFSVRDEFVPLHDLNVSQVKRIMNETTNVDKTGTTFYIPSVSIWNSIKRADVNNVLDFHPTKVYFIIEGEHMNDEESEKTDEEVMSKAMENAMKHVDNDALKRAMEKVGRVKNIDVGKRQAKTENLYQTLLTNVDCVAEIGLFLLPEEMSNYILTCKSTFRVIDSEYFHQRLAKEYDMDILFEWFVSLDDVYVLDENDKIIEICSNMIDKAEEDYEVFNKWLWRLKNALRKQYTVAFKRMIVKEIVKRKQIAATEKKKRKVVAILGKTWDLGERMLRKWTEKKELQPDYEETEGDYVGTFRIGKPGRVNKLEGEIIEKLKTFVEENTKKEKQCGSEDIMEFLFEEFGVVANAVYISRIAKKAGLISKVRTNKLKKAIDVEEMNAWIKWLSWVKKQPLIIILNQDEKPMPILIVSNQGYVTKGTKAVAFQTGGRGARGTQTLSVAGFVVLQFGRVKMMGKCGLGVLMKGGKVGSEPNAWKRRKVLYSGEILEIMNTEMYVKQTPKGFMLCDLFPGFLEFHFGVMEKKVTKGMELDVEEFIAIPKVWNFDWAPGHMDRKEAEFMKNLWEKWKPLNITHKKIVKNSSDYTQWADLGPNRCLGNLYKGLSREWIKEDKKTTGGNFKLPGKQKLLENYAKVYMGLDDTSIRTGWVRAGYTKAKDLDWEKKKK